MPERDFVIVHRCSVAINLSLKRRKHRACGDPVLSYVL